MTKYYKNSSIKLRNTYKLEDSLEGGVDAPEFLCGEWADKLAETAGVHGTDLFDGHP